MTTPTEDTLQTLRLVVLAMQCLESPTLSDAGRIGICLDIVGHLHAVLDTCLTATCARFVEARDIPDESWTALTDLAALVSYLPEAETSWIETAVGCLRQTERP